MFKKLGDREQVAQEVRRVTNEALQSERCMVVAFVVEDGKVVLKGRVAGNFPHGDFSTCVKLLMDDFLQSVRNEEEPAPEPLPVADFLKKALEPDPTNGDEIPPPTLANVPVVVSDDPQLTEAQEKLKDTKLLGPKVNPPLGEGFDG